MYYDPEGHFFLTALLITIGIAAGVGYAAYKDYKDDGNINCSIGWESYAIDGLIGGLIGGITALAIPYISSFAASSFSIGLPSISMQGGLLAISTTTITVSGTRIIQGLTILSGITIMSAIVGKSGGYTVKQFPNDYDPAHVHIFGDDITDKAHGIRIGLDGKPLPR